MINVIVKPDAIELPPGAVVRVPGTWQDYQALLAIAIFVNAEMRSLLERNIQRVLKKLEEIENEEGAE